MIAGCSQIQVKLSEALGHIGTATPQSIEAYSFIQAIAFFSIETGIVQSCIHWRTHDPILIFCAKPLGRTGPESVKAGRSVALVGG